MNVIGSIVVCYVKQLFTLGIDLLFLFSVWQVMWDGNIVHLSCFVEHHIVTIHLASNVYTYINQKKNKGQKKNVRGVSPSRLHLVIYTYTTLQLDHLWVVSRSHHGSWIACVLRFCPKPTLWLAAAYQFDECFSCCPLALWRGRDFAWSLGSLS